MYITLFACLQVGKPTIERVRPGQKGLQQDGSNPCGVSIQSVAEVEVKIALPPPGHSRQERDPGAPEVLPGGIAV